MTSCSEGLGRSLGHLVFGADLLSLIISLRLTTHCTHITCVVREGSQSTT